MRRECLYGLDGVYLDAYDAIVRPDRVFAIRVYTLRRWAPIFGATGFWLLVTLQQQCYRNPRGCNWCVVSREVLAEEAGLSETTVHRYLHDEEYVTRGLCHWIQLPDPEKARKRRRWSSRAGKVTQAPNRYAVVMDAPLAPVDQRGLAQFLQEQGASSGTPSAEIEPTLEHLAGLRLADLLKLFDEYAARFQPPAGWDERAFLPTVADVVSALGIQIGGDDGERTRFLDLCSKVQQALVGQVYLGTQYFLREWVPLLGHKLALVVVQLRSRCFWSEDTLRDEVSIGTKALAAASGCTPGWLRRAFKEPRTVKFFQVVSGGRGRQPTFRVTMREPIAPRDEAEHRALLNAGMIIPETGQLGLPKPDKRLGTPQTNLVNVSEPTNKSGERLGTLQTNLVNVSEPTSEPGEHHISTIIISTYPDKGLKKQKHTDDPAAATASLLENFGIGPPSNKRILTCCPGPDDVRAWMLYSLTQPGLDDSAIACGYVVKRLLAGEAPPPRFQVWAQLAPDEWRVLWRAFHYGGPYLVETPGVFLRFGEERGREEMLQAWLDDFAGIFPRGPFGHGSIDLESLRRLVLERLSPPGEFHLEERSENDCTLLAVPGDVETAAWLTVHRQDIEQLLGERGILHAVEVLQVLPGKPGNGEEGPDDNASQVWQATLGELQLQMTQATFDTWLRDSKLLEYKDGTIIVTVKSGYAKDSLEHRLHSTIERTAARVVGHPVEVRFVIPEEVIQ